MSKSKDCLFCKIASGKIPCHKIHEADNFLAFLDISPFTEGHTMVVPKKHHEFIWDVPNVGEYFQFVQKIGNHYRKTGYKFVDTITLGRMIPHSHVHVIPHNNDNTPWRKILDEINKVQGGTANRLSTEEGQKIAARLKLPD